ncbi:Mitochondrial substrate carrier family protein E [Galdieria sulphuraria]|nr:Mitochondrial substrate carrier family protein E [Galdieria sulphuraria]
MQETNAYRSVPLVSLYAVQLISGALAGLIADSSTHPLDTLRVRVQCVRKDHCPPSSFQLFKLCLQHESWKGLYRGFGAVVAFSIPAHALYFASYENAKRALEKRGVNEEISPTMAGVAAEFFGGLLWTPQDVIKQRSQLQGAPGVIDDGKYANLRRSVQTVWLEEGLRGFYRGYFIAFFSFAPFSALYFSGFEWSRKIMQRILRKSEEESNGFIDLVAGTVGGSLATVLTTPLDVLKTRYQVERSIQFDSSQTVFNIRSRPSITRIAFQLVKEEGIVGLFRGVGIRLRNLEKFL